MAKGKLKKQRNILGIITIILIIILIFIVTIQNPKKDKEIEYQKTCIDNCISEFDECLDNITKPTFSSNPKILDCLWNEDWCVGTCQGFGSYEVQKAMGI